MHHPFCDCDACMKDFKISQLRRKLHNEIQIKVDVFLAKDPIELQNENNLRSKLFDSINESLDHYLEEVTNPELRPKSE